VRTVVTILLWLALGAAVAAEDNVLGPREEEEGWILLFDGKTLNGWKTSGGKPSQRPVEDSSINPHKSGDYMLVYEKPFSDFILSLDFKTSEKECNSGVFIRTKSLTPLPGKDVGYNGLEVAIDSAKSKGFTDTGALYDLSAPTKNAMKDPPAWNRLVITCRGSRITIELNAEKVNDVDLSRFTEKNKRPDGTAHKFDIAYKDHPHEGYVGLQDHGSDVWFKNIKLKPLTGAGGKDASPPR
jgi:hypothetical protein